MADEAYRAVFLRVHPTGKMVLSLTTDSDGKEPDYAALVGRELGVPALDVKVVAADTDRFGEGHGYNTSPSDGRRRRRSPARRPRSATRRSCSRAWRSTRPPESLKWSNGAWVAGDGARPDTGQDDRGHRALRARHRRAAAGRRGRPRRADGLPRLASSLPSSATSTSSSTFSAPHSAEYGFMPHADCVTVAVGGELAVLGRPRARRRTASWSPPASARPRPSDRSARSPPGSSGRRCPRA